MVGLLDSEVREARERLRVSLHHINAALPAEKITVNYSPAGIVKSGTSFDLPTALVILAAQGKVPPERLRELWAVGEVGLDARIKQVRGVLAMLHAANQSAFRSYLIPFENLGEGLAVGKLPVMGVCSLEEAMEYVNASAQEQERMRRDAEDRWQSQAKGRMEKEKKTIEIPTWEKYALTIYEAAEYFGIGEHRLREIVRQNRHADFVLWIGVKVEIKMKLFEEYLNQINAL